MIKPEILEMVKECKLQCATCKYDNRGLCDGFELHTGRLPDNCNEKDIENILSFLTSQEVCEWIRTEKEYNTGCGHSADYLLRDGYCQYCGKKIKEVSM